MNPKFTVIVPTKNEVSNIDLFLAGIPQDVSLIVVDDSDDETGDRVRAARPDAQIIHTPCNIPEARQLGGEQAITDWLVFTDADVHFDTGYFSHAAMRIGGDLDALYGVKYTSDGENGRFYRSFSAWQGRFDRWGIPAVSGSNLLVKRTTFLESGGFDRSYTVNEDSEFGFRLKRLGIRIEFDERLIVYAHDHRRLARGAWRKNLHSVTRCALIYSGLMPERWKSADWGYWSNRDETSAQEAK